MATFEPAMYPLVSLYPNAQANQHGRDNFDSFLRKEFKARAKAFAEGSLELANFKRARDHLRRGGH